MSEAKDDPNKILNILRANVTPEALELTFSEEIPNAMLESKNLLAFVLPAGKGEGRVILLPSPGKKDKQALVFDLKNEKLNIGDVVYVAENCLRADVVKEQPNGAATEGAPGTAPVSAPEAPTPAPDTVTPAQAVTSEVSTEVPAKVLAAAVGAEKGAAVVEAVAGTPASSSGQTRSQQQMNSASSGQAVAPAPQPMPSSSPAPQPPAPPQPKTNPFPETAKKEPGSPDSGQQHQPVTGGKSAAGQSDVTTVKGRLKDRYGMPAPGRIVIATELDAENRPTNVKRNTTTRDDGTYELPLEAGKWEIEVKPFGDDVIVRKQVIDLSTSTESE